MEYLQYFFSLEWWDSDIRTIIVTLFCVFIGFLSRHLFYTLKINIPLFIKGCDKFIENHKITVFCVVFVWSIAYFYFDENTSPKLFSLVLVGLSALFVALVYTEISQHSDTTEKQIGQWEWDE